MEDAGRYSCEALNQAGRSEKHYNLNVWGEGLGVPPPHLPWLWLSRPRRGAASLFPAPFPSQPDTLLIHLSVPPPVPPVFPSGEPRTLTVTEGHPARLSCDCRGVPFPRISWRKDGMIASLALPRPRCPAQGGCSPPSRGAPAPEPS